MSGGSANGQVCAGAHGPSPARTADRHPRGRLLLDGRRVRGHPSSRRPRGRGHHEYGPQGITSNAICPGAVETDLTKAAGPSAAAAMGITYEQFLQAYADESMIKRLNTCDEVAAMAVLLASDVGGGITGALLNVDGGSSSW
jgi:hypothetical protein